MAEDSQSVTQHANQQFLSETLEVTDAFSDTVMAELNMREEELVQEALEMFPETDYGRSKWEEHKKQKSKAKTPQQIDLEEQLAKYTDAAAVGIDVRLVSCHITMFPCCLSDCSAQPMPQNQASPTSPN